MEEIIFSISVLQPFVRRCEFFLSVNDGVGRSNFFRYEMSDLALSDRSCMIFIGCREEVFPRSIYPSCYVLDNGDSYSRPPAMSTKLSGSSSVGYWCWYYGCRYCMTTLMATPVDAA
jgi:hypothetical protein